MFGSPKKLLKENEELKQKYSALFKQVNEQKQQIKQQQEFIEGMIASSSKNDDTDKNKNEQLKQLKYVSNSETDLSESDKSEYTHVIPHKSTKRKPEISPNQPGSSNQLRKKIATSNIQRSNSIDTQPRISDIWQSTMNENRFNALVGDDDNESANETETSSSRNQMKPTPRPPPLFIHGVEDYNSLRTELEKSIEKRYTAKVLPKLIVKVQTENKEDYKLVIGLLNDKKTEYHSYQLKDEKPFKVVLKGIHHNMDHKEIIQALSEKGHSVTNVASIRSKKTLQDLPMFFINLKAEPNNKAVYKIDRLLNMVVSIEPPRTQKAIPQCERCQRYGHTKKYCHLGPRCVKCPEKHLTADCPRTTKDSNVKCANCQGDHPANYRGCEIYQNLRRKLFPQLRRKTIEEPAANNFNCFIKPGQSFADHFKNPESQNQKVPPQSNDMAELKEMMKDLMGQISTMLNLLTAVVAKLK